MKRSKGYGREEYEVGGGGRRERRFTPHQWKLLNSTY